MINASTTNIAKSMIGKAAKVSFKGGFVWAFSFKKASGQRGFLE
ncbi:hypothetical protein PBI_SCTP2_351 [Salicola phage SCTP-2]|nr:hypothetical protein PBI_SCTP2_351 [Salicola phage SCTP-2]